MLFGSCECFVYKCFAIVKIQSNFASLLKNIDNVPAIADVLKLLDTSPSVSIAGLYGSTPSVVVWYLWRFFAENNKNLLVVCADKQAAEKIAEDIQLVAPEIPVLMYTETDEKFHYTAEQLDARLVGLTTVLIKLPALKRYCIVCTVPALCVPVPAPNTVDNTIITIQRGGSHSFQQFIDKLALNGFNRKDFVETTGDMAVRGGIVDVFPPGNDFPLRIEFWGDTIESIRDFDTLSQRSVREREQVSLITHLFHNDDHDVQATLFHYLPKDTLAVQIFPEEIQQMFESIMAKNGDVEGLKTFVQEGQYRLFTYPTVRCNALQDQGVHIHTLAQPPFLSSVHNLCREIFALTQQQTTVFLCSDSVNQMKRLKDLVESTIDSLEQSAHEKDDSEVLAATMLPGQNVLHFSQEQLSKIVFLPHSLSEGFIWNEVKVAVFTEHQLFGRRKSSQKQSRSSGSDKEKPQFTLKELQQLKPGDFVVHVDKGIAQFDGLETITVSGAQQECARLIFAGGDKMYVHLNYINRIQKYSAQEGVTPTLTKLGTNEWARKKDRTRKRIKDIARELIRLYAARKMQPAFSFPPDTLWQKEMEASFMYEDTPDQITSSAEVKMDMERDMPMDRLVCGDVGFGKTEVAIRAAFKAAQAGKQVAVLVPTTILAEQHFASFRDRLDRYAVAVDVLSRFRSASEQKLIIRRIQEGKIDILIGTHRLLSKDIQFRDLGLLIVDEEHRFGVSAKEKLRQLRVTVDTLTLTATPIPRTLNFSLMGARDVSVINTPPPNRLPVHTEILSWDDHIITLALRRELDRGGQIFVVSDKISDLTKLTEDLRDSIPTIRIGMAHGQMSPEELENTMEDFLERKTDVLVATKIIESGLDIPNANTIIINRADNFGLAELYQLRGRVGRSNIQAYCYLIIPPPQRVSRNALKRLQAIEEFTELGSGFQLAMRDMEIRGAGNLLGAEQSGFISDIGFELYQRILDEAVYEIKQEEFAELFDNKSGTKQKSRITPDELPELPKNDEITVDVEGDAMLPKYYISNDVERFEFYKKLFYSTSEDDLEQICSELRDRFGVIPPETEQLLNAVRLRISGLYTGFGHISFKKNLLVCEFPPEEKTVFYTRYFAPLMQCLSRLPQVRFIPKGKTVLVQVECSGLQEAQEFLRSLTLQVRKEL